MRFFPVLGGILVGVLVFSSVASAKMVNGKVASVDINTRKLTLSSTDAVTGQVSESEMWVNEDATFTGTASLGALHPGDTVWVEAEQDREGNWKASKVTKA